MAFEEKRRPVRFGSNSRAVTLPKAWLRFHGERAEELTLLGDAILLIAPRGYEGKARAMLDAAEPRPES